jgi:hypothetical protein
MTEHDRAPPRGLDRRCALALLAASPFVRGAGALAALGAGAAAQAVVPTDRITVLYRRESDKAPNRLDPAVQAATLALESEMINRGLKVLQPTAELYALMDKGQAVVVTFAEDAGFSMVFSAYRDLRPSPGQEGGVAEVRLQARVFVGRHILVADEGRGQMYTRLDPETREFGERRAMELAARRAAADLSTKAVQRLRALSQADIDALVPRPGSPTTGSELAPPPGAAPMPAPAAAAAPAPAAAAVAAAPSAPAGPLPAPRRRFALVIGMSDYSSVRANGQPGVNDLPGVARDTRFVVDSLKQLGYAENDTLVLRDAQATGALVRSAMKKLASLVGPDDVLLLFISAHGADKEYSYSGYGMPILADYRGGKETGELDFWELQSMAKNLQGRVVWVNDTCHSGGAATGVASVVVSSRGVGSGGEVRGPDAGTVARGTGGQSFAILTACGPQEISWEDGEGGVFTTRLFRALRKSGGQVPLARLFTEGVQRDVIETSRVLCQRDKSCATHPQQTPLFAFGGSGDQISL